MISKRIRRQLETLDWDFSEHLQGTTKAIHWYPGTFPSELPTTLIQALTSKEDLVLDPYGGVGTTALEALRQGRRAWLVEANPVGCLVSYTACCLVLLKSFERSLPIVLIEIIKSTIIQLMNRPDVSERLSTDDHIPKYADNILKNYVNPTPASFLKNIQKKPNLESLSKWIESDTLKDVLTAIDLIDDKKFGNFGRLLILTMISAVLRPASSQTQSWGHIADNVWPKKFEKKDFYKLCLNWLSRTDGIIKKTEVDPLPPGADKSIRFWMSVHSWQKGKLPKIKPDCHVDALITSPPYAGAIDYTLSQRLSLYMLGYTEDDVKSFCGLEIGARRKRFVPSSKTDWAGDLVDALQQQSSYLADEAALAFVLPHKDAGREIGPSSIEEFLCVNNFTKIMEIERSIVQGRARQSWTSIKKEIIQIYSY